MPARLARIFVYPVKSLDPLSVESAVILPSGALEHDRRFAIYDAAGKWVNGKRTPLVHLLLSRYDAARGTIQITRTDNGDFGEFSIDEDRGALDAWLSDYFGMPVHVRENREAGFPDDTDSPGPTLVSTATLEAVASWFCGMSVDEARLRFRANLEIDGVEPFWEDRLFAPRTVPVPFQIGSAELLGMNPCARCIVPTRNPTTGERNDGFAATFRRRREESLPTWAELEPFDHYYRLCVNTRVAAGQGPGRVAVGDLLRVDNRETA